MIVHDEGWFKIAGWFNFLSKFYGYDYGVSRDFVESFDDQWVQLGNLRFEVNEEFIARAELLTTGEQWFKK